MADEFAQFKDDEFSSFKDAPSRKGWHPVDETVGVIKGAAKKLADGVRDDYAANKRNAGKIPRPGNIFENELRTARFVGDAANVVMSPVAGLMHGFVTGPAADALSKFVPTYEQPKFNDVVRSVRGNGSARPRRLSPDEARQVIENDLNSAIGMVMPGRSGAAVGSRVTASAKAVEPNIYAARSAEFARANVEPSVAAVQGGGAAKLANAIADNPVAGARVRSQMRRQTAQAGSKAEALAAQYGSNRGPQMAGEAAQTGVRRFARDKSVAAPGAAEPAKRSSFAAKADTLYDEAFGPIESAENAAVTGSKQAFDVESAKLSAQRDAQVSSQRQAYDDAVQENNRLRSLGLAETPLPPQPTSLPAVQASPQAAAITPSATASTLGEISQRVNGQQLSRLITDSRIGSIASALEGDAHNVRFGDLRQLRTWVRNAQRDPTLRQGLPQADLQRIEGALTQDIYSNAEKLAGPEALAKLKRADAYYRAGSERIDRSLQAFDSANGGEQAYARIQQAAGSTSAADARKLIALKRSLSPDEWGDIAATTLTGLGRPTTGAANALDDGAFSINTFLTNYAKLSPAGREVVFGARGGGGEQAARLKAELDNLARVSGYLKDVQKGANTSNSAVSVQGMATIAGIANPSTFIPTSAALGGAAGVGEFLTNPVAVRWLSRLGQTQARNPKALPGLVQRLSLAAKHNAALVPLLAQAQLVLEGPGLTAKAAAEPQSTAETPR